MRINWKIFTTFSIAVLLGVLSMALWAAEQAVIVQFSYASKDLSPLFALEASLEKAIMSAAVGEYDGNEVGGGEAALYMYGPDAEKLFDVVSPILNSNDLSRGAKVTKRYGPPEPGVKEQQFYLNKAP